MGEDVKQTMSSKDIDIRNKDLSIECLKGIIKRKELKISGYQMDIQYLNLEIDKLKSRPFWRFWE